jgi:hypothetical protein
MPEDKISRVKINDLRIPVIFNSNKKYSGYNWFYLA